jgi:nicotinamidase-related amidase
MHKALIVIDMQSGFGAENFHRAIKRIQQEIEQAMADNDDIIFLEFGGYGDTIPVLRYMVEGYDNVVFKTKYEDDGSEQVLNYVRSSANKIDSFTIAGINTPFCVYSTVYGLREIFEDAKIEVVADACDSKYNDHHEGLDKIRKLKDVSVI